MNYLDKTVFFLIFLSVMSTSLEFSLAVKFGSEASAGPAVDDLDLVHNENVSGDQEDFEDDDDYGIDEDYDDFEDEDYDEDGEDYDYEEENRRN